ncbi:hypothetical protein K1719_036568 [Acacia pycnantha]|nr:hypothetical protein K1719_036568 [Acacia pycnantha]
MCAWCACMVTTAADLTVSGKDEDAMMQQWEEIFLSMTKQMGVSDFSLPSLLLLSLLLAKVKGIRLDRESLAAVQQQKQHLQDDEESNLMEKSNGEADEEVILCKNKQCTDARHSLFSSLFTVSDYIKHLRYVLIATGKRISTEDTSGDAEYVEEIDRRRGIRDSE